MTTRYRIIRSSRIFKKYYIQISINNKAYENYLLFGNDFYFWTESGARKFIESISDVNSKIIVKDEAKI